MKLLSALPAAQELGLSLAQVADLSSRVDIWRALAGTVGYIITQAMAHSPKRERAESARRSGHVASRLPGCRRSLRQQRCATAGGGKGSLVHFPYPRCVVSTGDFLEGIAASDVKSRCLVCGSSTQVGCTRLTNG